MHGHWQSGQVQEAQLPGKGSGRETYFLCSVGGPGKQTKAGADRGGILTRAAPALWGVVGTGSGHLAPGQCGECDLGTSMT